MKTKIRWRNGTREESLPYAVEVAAGGYRNAQQDAADIALPDGHKDAVRVQFNRDTGEVIRSRRGNPMICAPWALSGVFQPA